MNLAVIPARGGSKRIPRKNLREFAGKPIIAWSIDAALSSGHFDQVIVSTDDVEIAEVARQFGADVPFVRPPELSDDHTPTIPVIRHAIEWTESHGQSLENVCCIYATAPFVTAEALRAGYELLRGNPGTEFVLSATTFPFPILRALKRNEDGTIGMFWPEHELTRSQDLPEAYHDAGQFYWATREAFMTRSGMFTARSRLLLLPRARVQDIDSLEDWVRAERLFELLKTDVVS